ncbi:MULTISPECIES: hypothetical protein [unclassified Acinetobacter]|jgi:hypothetical protein|uniref:hypothetical protein n=1 Tax=Acinetobacter TaxID=469 RepID=UPI002574EB71|nr:MULTISPECIES: hypothetical protein [unclassified Acinetobacter]MDM1765970.1 hypothetical protein [Acinetobacter sp. 226-1]MDM1769724.1 hypothetical protein [Acinetobacter sp. 226-4]
MATRGRPAKVLSSKDLFELEEFLMNLDFLKKNQQRANTILHSKEYDELDEKDLRLLKIVHREKVQFEQRQRLITQIQLKQSNKQPLLANEIEILQLLEKEQDQETFFRLDRALQSYQKLEKAALDDRIRLENEHRREVLRKTAKTLSEAQRKRNIENQRKYELGGAVLAAFKQLNIDISQSTPDQIKNRIINNKNFVDKVKNTKIFNEVKKYQDNYFNREKLFVDVIQGLATWSKDEKPLCTIEIIKHKDKYS